MEKRVLISTVILLALGGLVHAHDAGLHGVLDITYQSKYLWRGFDVYNDKSAVQPSLDLDLFGTGLGLRAEGHRANSSGHENTERWDHTLYYKNVICPDEAHATHYMLGYRYFNYPQQSSHTRGGTVNPVVGTDPAVQRRFLMQALMDKRPFEYGTIGRGMVAMTLLVLTAGTLVLIHRRSAVA